MGATARKQTPGHLLSSVAPIFKVSWLPAHAVFVIRKAFSGSLLSMVGGHEKYRSQPRRDPFPISGIPCGNPPENVGHLLVGIFTSKRRKHHFSTLFRSRRPQFRVETAAPSISISLPMP
jgi:hypothetical protein